MKFTYSLPLITILGVAAVTLSGCSKSDTVPSATQSTKETAREIAADVKTTASDSWDSIKDYSYEKREEFAASLDRMAAKHDTEIREMNAKIGGLPDDAAKERDRANHEFKEACADLNSKLTDLRKSSAETWSETKGKATEAWQRVQASYEKLKSDAKS